MVTTELHRLQDVERLWCEACEIARTHCPVGIGESHIRQGIPRLAAENARLCVEVERLHEATVRQAESIDALHECCRLSELEADNLRDDNLQLVNDLEAEGARVGMLTAENARLRADNRKLDDAIIAERQYNGEANDRIKRLTADLARVTGERDALLKAARARLDIAARVEITPYGDNPAWIAVVADWEAAENALHLAIAACAPPASGEEG